MPTVVTNIQEQSRTSRDKSGYHDTMIARVEGLLGTPEQRRYLALQQPGLPLYGDYHPVIPGITVIRQSAEVEGSGQVLVTTEYGPPEFGKPSELPLGDTAPPHIEIGVTTQSVTSQKDIDGNDITVEHRFIYPDSDPEVADIAVGQTKQRGEVILVETLEDDEIAVTYRQVAPVQVQESQVVVRLRRRELSPPGDKAKHYVGLVNHTPFLGDVRRSWLCTEISGSSQDGGETYEVLYAFQRVWPHGTGTVAFIDPVTGGPATGLVEGVGLKTDVPVYFATDFHTLNLPGT